MQRHVGAQHAAQELQVEGVHGDGAQAVGQLAVVVALALLLFRELGILDDGGSAALAHDDAHLLGGVGLQDDLGGDGRGPVDFGKGEVYLPLHRLEGRRQQQEDDELKHDINE